MCLIHLLNIIYSYRFVNHAWIVEIKYSYSYSYSYRCKILNVSLRLNKCIKKVVFNDNKRIICHNFDVKKWTPYTWICRYDINKNCFNRFSELFAIKSSFPCGLFKAKEKVRSLSTLCLHQSTGGRVINLLLGWVNSVLHTEYKNDLVETVIRFVKVVICRYFFNIRWRTVH